MEEIVKKKRGRPRKVQLAEPLQELIDEVKEKENQEIKLLIEEVKKEKTHSNWDISKEDKIEFFDSNLSYEITGYRPINKTKGLDFNPKLYMEVRETFKRTGQYCLFPRGSKAYIEFWTREYDRCRNGLEVNGYKITGDHYFFLNYYQLANLLTAKLGEGRLLDFPEFFVALYEWLHYVELCKVIRKNAVLMKARGVGQRPT